MAEYFEQQIEQDRRRRRIRLAVIGAVVTLAAIGGWFFFLRKGSGRLQAPPLPSWLETPGAETPLAQTPTPAPPTPTPGPTLTPAAEETLDDLVRRVVGGLSSHPQVLKLLATPGLMRRFVVSVDNVAEGKSPRQNLVALDPRDDFAVSRRGERIFVDPKSYARYDPVAEAIDSIDVAGVAAAFAELEPRLDQTYRELGYPDRRFREVLKRALERLERVPVPSERVELRAKVKSYRFTDS
ncbi:MAG: DUF3014 domain-containing protein, partial [Candidatus Binatia bacterium]